MADQRIEVIAADITGLDVDVIVNAANEELAAECAQIPGGCPTGEARITHGYDLKATYVIHAVGPIWQGGDAGEAELLGQCYRRALGLVVGNNLATIAFPAISTGIYGFPIGPAAEIAVSTVAEFLDGDDRLQRVVFCCFGPQSIEAHQRALEKIQK